MTATGQDRRQDVGRGPRSPTPSSIQPLPTARPAAPVQRRDGLSLRLQRRDDDSARSRRWSAGVPPTACSSSHRRGHFRRDPPQQPRRESGSPIRHPNSLTCVGADLDNYLFVTRMGITLTRGDHGGLTSRRAPCRSCGPALQGWHRCTPRGCPPRLHAAQHPGRQGAASPTCSTSIWRCHSTTSAPDLPHLLQGQDLRLAGLVGRARDDRSGADGLADQHRARHLRDLRRAARAVHRSAAVRPGRRYVGAADPDRRGRGGRRQEQGVLPRRLPARAARGDRGLHRARSQPAVSVGPGRGRRAARHAARAARRPAEPPVEPGASARGPTSRRSR